jgi:hypothetical protein
MQYRGAPFAQARLYRAYANRARWPRSGHAPERSFSVPEPFHQPIHRPGTVLASTHRLRAAPAPAPSPMRRTTLPSPEPERAADPQHAAISDSGAAADEVLEAYAAWIESFDDVTARAPQRFGTRDWAGMEADASERLTLYSAAVEDAVGRLRGRIAPSADAGEHALKRAYAARIQGRTDAEVAETFFNSVVRRVLGTAGVDARTEFTADPSAEGPDAEVPCRVYPAEALSPALFRRVLEETRQGGAMEDAGRDAEAVAAAVREQLGDAAERVPPSRRSPTSSTATGARTWSPGCGWTTGASGRWCCR